MVRPNVPPHARAGTIGRGHRFAAYPRCSTDQRRSHRTSAKLARAADQMTSQVLRRAARVNGGACVVLLALFALLRTHHVFPNEYGVPDGAMLFFLGLAVVLPVSALLVVLGISGLKRAVDPVAQRRAILLAAMPLTIPVAMGVVAVFPFCQDRSS